MNTNYNIPQSKLTPRQISAFNKLNPYTFLEKDYSLTPSSNISYRELFSRYYHNDDGSLGPLKNKEKSDENEYKLRFQIEKEAKLNQLKKEAKDKKEKEERKREKDFQEKEKLERKEQAKQYNELIRRQIEQYKKEEEKKNQLQKDYFKKQLNWQKQEAQFKKKMKKKKKWI